MEKYKKLYNNNDVVNFCKPIFTDSFEEEHLGKIIRTIIKFDKKSYNFVDKVVNDETIFDFDKFRFCYIFEIECFIHFQDVSWNNEIESEDIIHGFVDKLLYRLKVIDTKYVDFIIKNECRILIVFYDINLLKCIEEKTNQKDYLRFIVEYFNQIIIRSFTYYSGHFLCKLNSIDLFEYIYNNTLIKNRNIIVGVLARIYLENEDTGFIIWDDINKIDINIKNQTIEPKLNMNKFIKLVDNIIVKNELSVNNIGSLLNIYVCILEYHRQIIITESINKLLVQIIPKLKYIIKRNNIIDIIRLLYYSIDQNVHINNVLVCYVYKHICNCQYDDIQNISKFMDELEKKIKPTPRK